ncbi:MAG: ABC transporter ATP-binding protein [Thermoguttaceae bacterium]|nr:ABC transporter ATP-binding protein [Thermoguttaceae bacterium]
MNDFNALSPSSTSLSDAEKIVEFRRVSKTYGAKRVLEGVSFSIERGSVFALLGENGVGKTTAIKILLGEIAATHGTATVFGLDARRDALTIRRRVGYVPEVPALYERMTVAEMGRFAAAFYENDYWGEYSRLIAEYEIDLNAKIKRLSKGLKALVSFSVALACQPDLLILDEPTSGLDALARRRILETLADFAASGGTALIASHQMAEVERVADRVAMLRDERLLLDEPLLELKERTRVVTATVRDLSPEDRNRLFNGVFATVLKTDVWGDQIRVVGRDPASDFESEIRAKLGDRLLALETSTPSLEEIFVAAMTQPAK